MKKTNTIIAAAACLALALGLTGCGQKAEQAPEPDTGIKLEVKAEGWVAGESTPVVAVFTPMVSADEEVDVCLACGKVFSRDDKKQAHSEGADGRHDADDPAVYTRVAFSDRGVEGYPVPDVYAIPANEEVAIDLYPGSYSLSFVSPINADGSIYDANQVMTLTSVAHEVTAIELVELKRIPADQATSEQVTAIVSALTVALADQAGVPDAEAILELAQKNAKANPNVTDEAVAAAEQQAAEAVESGTATVAGAAQASGAASQGGGSQGAPAASDGSGGGASQAAPSAPAHTHSFQPVYYTTQVQVGSQVVCSCGQTFSSNGEWTAHNKADLLSGGPGHSYSVQPIYQTQQLVSHYQCSCGAIQ